MIYFLQSFQWSTVRTTWTHLFLCHIFGLKNVQDDNHFMSILLFPLKGVCYCICVLRGSTSRQTSHPSLRMSRHACMHMCVRVCLYVSLSVCVSTCVLTRGHNSTQDSFIKCGAASKAAVNQFYLLCVGGQLSWHPQTLTPQEWTGCVVLLQLCCCRLVVRGDLFFFQTWFTWGKRTVAKS